MALVMIVFAGGVICADEIVFTPTSATAVSASKNIEGITVSFKNTYNNKSQITAGNKMTLTIKGLPGVLKSLKLNIKKSGSSTTGNLSVSVGETSIYTNNSLQDVVSTTQEEKEFTFDNDLDGDITIVVTSTKKSLYCNSFTIVYDKTSTDPSKTTTSLSFGEEYDGKTITKTTDDKEFTIPATLTPSIDGAEITYSSSNKSVAEVDNTGKVTLNAKTGTATITAEYAGDDTYAPSSVSYTVQVKKPVAVEDGVFDFTSGELDYGSGLKPRNNDSYNNKFDSSTKWGNGIVNILTTGNTRWFLGTDDVIDFRLYNKAKMTISVPSDYIIAEIQFEGNDVSLMKADKGNLSIDEDKNSSIWTGNTNSITCTASGTNKIYKITVTYYKALTTAASSFATYAADDAVDYSAVGLTAYAIELNEAEGKVAYNEISETVEAGTPVLVKGEASTSYAMIPSTETATAVTTALQISDGSVTAADNLYYGFATLNGVSGFKLVQNGVTIPAKKGYLKLSSAGNAKTFYAFDGNTTGIEETFSNAEAEKALAPMYNISGQRVGEGYKGIVIVNGKKYVK